MGHLNWRIIGAIIVCAAFIQTVHGQTGRNPTQARLREIQRQYQKLVQDLQAEEAKIQQRRAEYGQTSLEATKDAIGDLIGYLKNTPTYEDPGSTVQDYADRLQKYSKLVNTVVKTVQDIIESKTALAEKDLRIQKLNQDLVKANAAVKAINDSHKAVQKPTKQLPDSSRDWSELDKAIENMRKEDQTFLEEENKQLGSSSSQSNKKVCPKCSFVGCRTQFSDDIEVIICFDECLIAEDRCLGRSIEEKRLITLDYKKVALACKKDFDACDKSCGPMPQFSNSEQVVAWYRCGERCVSRNKTCRASLPEIP